MKFYLIPLLLIPSLVLAADLAGTTESGLKIILHENGKWEYDSSGISKDTSSPSKTVPTGFRGTKWGQSRILVRETEKAKILEKACTNEILGYQATVGRLDALIVYYFFENKLFKANYIFQEEHSNKNDYIIDFDKIKEMIKKTYGEPKSDDINWRNDLYKDNYEEWGMAIAVGHLSYYATWETPLTDVMLYLEGDNYDIKMGVEYLSKELYQEVKAHKENKAAKDF